MSTEPVEEESAVGGMFRGAIGGLIVGCAVGVAGGFEIVLAASIGAVVGVLIGAFLVLHDSAGAANESVAGFRLVVGVLLFGSLLYLLLAKWHAEDRQERSNSEHNSRPGGGADFRR